MAELSASGRRIVQQTLEIEFNCTEECYAFLSPYKLKLVSFRNNSFYLFIIFINVLFFIFLKKNKYKLLSILVLTMSDVGEC